MVPLNMCILPNYGKTIFITHFKNLNYLYAFVGDKFNLYSLLFYVISNRLVEQHERTDSLFRNVAVSN